MSLKKEIAARLNLYDGGDGVEYELWIDPVTKIIYEVPLEIQRCFSKAEQWGKLSEYGYTITKK